MLEGQGKNCIGVRCANESSCETVPQMYGEYQDLQIAHVSGRGLKNINIGKMDPSSLVLSERGSIVVRAHASHAEGLRFEPDSMPSLNTRSLFTQQ